MEGGGLEVMGPGSLSHPAASPPPPPPPPPPQKKKNEMKLNESLSSKSKIASNQPKDHRNSNKQGKSFLFQNMLYFLANKNRCGIFRDPYRKVHDVEIPDKNRNAI